MPAAHLPQGLKFLPGPLSLFRLPVLEDPVLACLGRELWSCRKRREMSSKFCSDSSFLPLLLVASR